MALFYIFASKCQIKRKWLLQSLIAHPQHMSLQSTLSLSISGSHSSSISLSGSPWISLALLDPYSLWPSLTRATTHSSCLGTSSPLGTCFQQQKGLQGETLQVGL